MYLIENPRPKRRFIKIIEMFFRLNNERINVTFDGIAAIVRISHRYWQIIIFRFRDFQSRPKLFCHRETKRINVC